MSDQTEGPGNAAAAGSAFTVTHWTVVLQARDKSESALSTLFESYRKPLLLWAESNLARHGQPRHLAEDQVQGFLVHLLERNFLENVGPEKGRFRSFLLSCFKHYLRDLADRDKAAKRGGGRAVVSLDEAGEDNAKVHDPASPSATPDKEYDRAWARSVMANSMHRLKDDCAAQREEKLFTELQSVMHADEMASSYREIGAKLGLTEGAVKIKAYRMRIRLSELIREEVRQTIADEKDLEVELRYLMDLFGR